MTTTTAGRRIHILPEYLANQIAAGEVVERPASVVKELTENALDAGATAIEVSVEGGGLQLIRVADNGCGMGPEDAAAAFERHATSKISSPEDLEKVSTLGFRGEALPSIASVSRCTLTTAPPTSLEGTRVEIEGGRFLGAKPAGCPKGTVVEVRDLFFNTPARRKFLKTPATELSQIASVVTVLALAHESVAFKLTSGARSVVSVPAVESLVDRAAGLFGRQLAEALLEVSGEADGLTVRGLASPPAITRSNRNQQYLILGTRPFQDRRLAYAVAKAYEGFLTSGRHPVAVLRLSVDPYQVDVNVHPTKQEVRFQRPGEVFDLVCGSIRASLEGGVRPRTVSAPEPTADFDRRQRVEQAIESFLVKTRPREEIRPITQHQRGIATPSTLTLTRPRDTLLSLIDRGRYVGQLYQTYLCFESDSGLILVDQHVAHERVLYEKMASQRVERGIASQDLLVPLTLELSPAESTVLEERAGVLEELGLTVEPFGGSTAAVKRVPVLWEGEDVEEKVHSLLDALVELDGKAPEDEVREKALVAAACKAALKAGRSMSEPEALSLVEALVSCQSPLVCPHGRPVVLFLERAEIERRFQVK